MPKLVKVLCIIEELTMWVLKDFEVLFISQLFGAFKRFYYINNNFVNC